MLMIAHGLCGLMMLVNQFWNNLPWLYTNAALAVIQSGMLITMIYAFQYCIELPENSLWESDVLEFKQFNFWLMAEFGICMFALVTTVLYLFIRLFIEQKVVLDLKNGGFAKETDFVVSHHLVIAILNAFCSPAFLITCMVLYFLDENSLDYKLLNT